MKAKTDFVAPMPPTKRELRVVNKALGTIQDQRQEAKVKYPIGSVILLVVAAVAGNARTWVDIEDFGKAYARELADYLQIEQIPSHDTIERVMSLVSPLVLQRIYLLWCMAMHFEKIEVAPGVKLLNLDGKEMRGSKGRGRKAAHVESAWDPQRGICLGQVTVDDKSNEITAIPELLDMTEIAGYVITFDAMGTQTDIAKKIIDRGADYLMAVKRNQETLYDELREYAADPSLLDELKAQGLYKRDVEKAHSQIEVREYWQTGDIDWLSVKGRWAGIKSIGFERSTIEKKGEKSVTWRYFISSLEPEIRTFAGAVRGHWRIESMHNILDVTLKEDANKTIDRTSAENLNIVRKWVVTILKHITIGRPKASMRSKSYMLSLQPIAALEMLMAATE